MQNKEIYDKWTKFINDDKYKKYFGSNKQIWLKKLQQVKNYIDINNILPSSGDINNHIKELALWIMYQKGCYKKINKIMKDKDIYATQTKFINDDKYKIYFRTNKDIWIEKLRLVKLYIDNNNELLSSYNANIEIKSLSRWITH